MNNYQDLYPATPYGRRPLQPGEARYADLVNTPHRRRHLIDGYQQRAYATALRATPTSTKTATTISGIAVPYNEWTPVGLDIKEQFQPSAFTELVRDQSPVPLMIQHDHTRLPVGVSQQWQSTPAGLVGTWRLDTEDQAAVDALRKVREGFVTGLSIGFAGDLEDQDVTMDSDGVLWITQCRNIRLLEVSIVALPAYPGAQITQIG